jgi:protein-S-isoprenylcysteine O-methyltransferase Ste14
MGGLVSVLYGGVAYTLFLGTILYAIAFVGNLPVPKTIDSGDAGSLPLALIVDTALLSLFAVQHSLMARPAFKRWWTKIVPEPVERATFVLFSNFALILLFWQWQPMPQPVWSVADRIGVFVLHIVFWAGWGLVFLSTFLINHFELFGLRQVWCRLIGKSLPPPAFRTPSLYRHVRHPLYLGFLLAFWSTPVMTIGHLLFAAATTGYILIAIQLEERDMIAVFGKRYRRYREQVSMLIPLPWRRVRLEEISAGDIDKL